jgi:hypothetical protein
MQESIVLLYEEPSNVFWIHLYQLRILFPWIQLLQSLDLEKNDALTSLLSQSTLSEAFSGPENK